MPVKLNAPNSSSLLPINGVKLGFAQAHIRKPNRKDLLVMTVDEGSHVAGVFTQNSFALHLLFCVKIILRNRMIFALYW